MNTLKDDQESIEKMGTKKRETSVFWLDFLVIALFIVFVVVTISLFAE